MPDGGGGAELLTGVAPRTWKDNAYFFKVWRLLNAASEQLILDSSNQRDQLLTGVVPRTWMDNAHFFKV